MKYNVEAEGHSATVEIQPDGAGGFTGSIAAAAFGTGPIHGTMHADGALVGQATLGGHVGDFVAHIDGQDISGSVSVRIFFITKSASFTGTEVA